jgi:dihydrofolate synthase/folylpolyglutamate synthase
MRDHPYLARLVHFGVKFGLGSTRTLCAALGHPERASPTLLVAGTNGKGSVVAYLDHALRACGRRVGRYTSPHLVHLNERIVVDGRALTDVELDDALRRVREAADDLQAAGVLTHPPTHFEVLTVAAFDVFRRAGVDVAVLEVGMGGRLDATNVTNPLVSAIVSIDLDHEAYLGSTLAAIAREKAGVLRQGRVSVLGPMADEARAAIEDEARAVGATLVTAVDDGRDRDVPALPGVHQRVNLRVALTVLEAARSVGLDLDLARAREGIASTAWPGRLQWIAGEPPLLLDGAHNPAGGRALATHLATLDRPFVLLFGAMRDKAHAEVARALFPLASEIVVTSPPVPRAATPEEILAAAPPGGVPAHAERDVAAAFELARTRARGRGPVVVAGSLYLVGEVMALLEQAPEAVDEVR